MAIIETEPSKPKSGRDQSQKGGNKDPNTWQVVRMNDDPQKWKVTDGQTNIADLIDSKDDAEQYIKWYQWKIQQGHTQPQSEGQLIDDVKIPYATTGKTRTSDVHWNKRDDGLRLDYEDNKQGEFIDNALVFYGTFKDDLPDDEITFKWSWDRHSKKGALVKAYGVGCNNRTGKTRGRMEWEHPDYSKNKANGNEGTVVNNGKSLGYMGIRRNMPNGNVLMEYWQDRGGLDNNGKPANDWIKLLTWEDSEYKVTDYPKGIECTVRIDDEKKGWKNVDVKKSLLVELEPLK